MTQFPARNPAYADATRAGHERQAMMRTMGMRLARVAPGEVDVTMPYDARFAEGGGALHGGAVTAGLDTACASSAASLQDAGSSVTTAELKTSFLRPAMGESFRFEGRVTKAGRNLVFTEGRAWAIAGGNEILVATMTSTLMVIPAARTDAEPGG